MTHTVAHETRHRKKCARRRGQKAAKMHAARCDSMAVRANQGENIRFVVLEHDEAAQTNG